MELSRKPKKLFSPRPRDLPEESHKDETRREDEASVSHYCCNLHCSVFCILLHYIHSHLSMRLISIEWLTVILNRKRLKNFQAKCSRHCHITKQSSTVCQDGTAQITHHARRVRFPARADCV